MEPARIGRATPPPATALETRHGRGTDRGKEHGDEGPVATKEPRVEEYEEEEDDLTVLDRFRRNWTRTMSPFVGPLDATTGKDVGPMRYTDSGPPCFGGIPYDAMEIFSLKVTELGGGLEWPLRVFGLVAVRDSMDYKRNVLFQRSKDDCQVLTAEDPYLVLTGPRRAIALIDPPGFEVDLSVVGRMPPEEKVLSALYFQYNNICSGRWAGQVRTLTESSEQRSTIELKFAHLSIPLEATVEVRHKEGSSDFHGRFYAQMESVF
ncbi:hypothetical protein ACP70R_038163 [Stipagrostis hirtigluma subsp. patula]